MLSLLMLCIIMWKYDYSYFIPSSLMSKQDYVFDGVLLNFWKAVNIFVNI